MTFIKELILKSPMLSFARPGKEVWKAGFNSNDLKLQNSHRKTNFMGLAFKVREQQLFIVVKVLLLKSLV